MKFFCEFSSCILFLRMSVTNLSSQKLAPRSLTTIKFMPAANILYSDSRCFYPQGQMLNCFHEHFWVCRYTAIFKRT